MIYAPTMNGYQNVAMADLLPENLAAAWGRTTILCGSRERRLLAAASHANTKQEKKDAVESFSFPPQDLFFPGCAGGGGSGTKCTTVQSVLVL